MKPGSYRAVLFVLLLLCLPQVTLAQSNEGTVKVWLSIDREELVPYLENDQWISDDAEMMRIFEDFQVRHCDRAFPSSRKEALLKVYEIHGSGDFDKLKSAFEKINFCHGIEPAPEYELLSTNTFPDDYNLTFANDYALDLINAEQAWEYSTGDPNTVIGIVDGAFYTNHEELVGAAVFTQNPVFASQYFYQHGNAVAVAAAGNTNNGMGKSSIGYDCSLALINMGYNEMLDLCYQGVRVINVSWSSGCQNNIYFEQVMDELFENDVIVVASAGNGNTCGGPFGVVYPASLEGVISVTSVGPQDNHELVIGNPNTTHQSNQYVDICAPGYHVAGTPMPGYYLTGNGSSFAAPYVTGTIGLMLSLRPCLSREEVIEILSITAADVYASNSTDLAGLLGAGRLDAGAALEYVANYECQPSTPTLVFDGTIQDLSVFNPKPNSGNNPNVNGTQQYLGQVAGIHETQKLETQLFPNPSNGTFQITWNVANPEQIIVLDGAGRIIQEVAVVQGTNNMERSLDQTGIYFVQFMENATIVANEKVVVFKADRPSNLSSNC